MKRLYVGAICAIYLFFFSSTKALAAPSINNVNFGSSTPKYDKFEITFNINSSTANNFYLPYDPSPPPGIEGNGVDRGITVTGVFTDPNGVTYQVPAFYYQEFDTQVKNNKDWLYPTTQFNWKLRFMPHITGNWNFKISAQDSGGYFETSSYSFNVVQSSLHGPIRVSQDPRYFEHHDGRYFPGLGFNLNAGNLDIDDPVLGNTSEFTSMGQNGLQLSRVWISQKSIYGSAWGGWLSPNPAHNTNEPVMGIVHSSDAKLQNYPLSPPTPIDSHEFYMWLNYDETVAGDGKQYNFTPCRGIGGIQPALALKPNKTYRVRVRYNVQGLIPNDPNQDYGLVIKQGDLNSTVNWTKNPETRCYMPTQGTILAASFDSNDPWTNYPDPNYPGWMIMEREFTSGSTQNFVDKNIFLALHNLSSPGTNQSGGHAFIDEVWLEEKIGTTTYGENIIYKPNMGHHKYINQRNAKALDMILDLAKSNEVYLKMVMLDKNDDIFEILAPDGTFSSTGNSNYFYGTDNNKYNQVRWLHKAWWRYMQARWGYSQNVHSWELLNEGPDGPVDGPHWIMADDFGKYMRCGVFGVDPGTNCTFNHPNWHLTTTSFWSQSLPYHFWKNTSGNYPNLDYVDVHDYIRESISTDLPFVNDAAFFHYDLSNKRSALSSIGFGKPIIRGETGWDFINDNQDFFEINASDGLWVHNWVWAHAYYGGAMEQYWVGGSYERHLYCLSNCGNYDHDNDPATEPIAVTPFDHRPKFRTFHQFIKDIPLNNGHYQDLDPTVNNTAVRVWGQKDLVNQRAHAWIQNSYHTWRNVAENNNIPAQSATISFSGFPTNQQYQIEWWDTNTGEITSTSTISSNASGQIQISVSNLTTDKAFRIGSYDSPSPTPTSTPGVPGDANGDGLVNIQDYVILSNTFGSTTDLRADFNGDGAVNIQDYVILSNNFGN